MSYILFKIVDISWFSKNVLISWLYELNELLFLLELVVYQLPPLHLLYIKCHSLTNEFYRWNKYEDCFVWIGMPSSIFWVNSLFALQSYSNIYFLSHCKTIRILLSSYRVNFAKKIPITSITIYYREDRRYYQGRVDKAIAIIVLSIGYQL